MYHQHSLQSRRCTSATLVALAILCGLLAGCVTETVPAPRKLGIAATADVCQDNMHDLSGYLLEYYWQHHEFPEKLADLQPLVDFDHKLSVVCPVSGNAYLYYPSGLVVPGDKRRLLVVDSEPTHAGGRWAIVARPAEGSQPVILWVIALDEATLKRYQPAATQP